MKKKLRKQLHKQYPWWDYEHLLKMLKDWLDHSSKMHANRGNLVKSVRTSREMKIAVNLIARIEDNNYDTPNKVFPCRNGHVNSSDFGWDIGDFYYNKAGDDLRKQDIDYLFNFMKKHILTWWD
ncbi:MAG: hypothetical protein GY861_10890 [bacterium]|nr:hypothetical protein [bacterium]